MRFVPILTASAATAMSVAAMAAPAVASVPPADELPDAMRRLVVSPTGESALLVLDAGTGDVVAELDVPSPVTYASALTENGRYLLAAHEDGVSIVDGGVWSEPHGGHAHHYATAPSVLGHVAGERPSHLISDDEVSALWFDGLGTATVIDEAALAGGEVVVAGDVGGGEPHHGFAVPAGDGQFVVSAMAGPEDDGLPDAVEVVDDSGAPMATFECVETHGEASFGRDTYAAACADGILIITETDAGWTSELVAYPATDEVDPYGMGDARAWAVAPGSGVVHGVGAFGTRHLFVVDPIAGELSTFDLGAQIATFGVRPLGADRGVLVLTTDGSLHRVDTFAGTIESTVSVVEPFAEGDDFDITYHQLVAGGGSAFVTDPRRGAIVEVELGEELALGATFELGVEAAYIALFNG